MSEPLNDISTPEQLRALLTAEGVNDSVVNDFVAQIGAQAVLERVFAIMEQRFKPEKAGDKAHGSVQWEIKTSDGVHTWTISFVDGAAKAGEGPANDPRVTLRLSLADFLRLVSRQLNGVQAVITGKLRFSGEIMFAQSMQDWFDW